MRRDAGISAGCCAQRSESVALLWQWLAFATAVFGCTADYHFYLLLVFKVLSNMDCRSLCVCAKWFGDAAAFTPRGLLRAAGATVSSGGTVALKCWSSFVPSEDASDGHSSRRAHWLHHPAPVSFA